MGALNGEVAIVTGAGRGIGLTIARALASEGSSVALAARSASEVQQGVTGIERDGGRAIAVPTDVADPAQVYDLRQVTEATLDPVTLLVNNAGTPGPVGADWEVDPDEWWRCVEVIVKGSFLCARAVLPGMIARGQGRIINVASTSGTGPRPGLTATSVAKTAQIRFSEGLAEETMNLGVKVLTIHPGLVKTALVESYLQSPELNRWAPGLDQADFLPPALAGALCVRIARGEADTLAGRFLRFSDDLDDLGAKADDLRDDERLVLRLIEAN